MGRCKFGYHKAIKRSGYPPSFWKNLSSQNKKMSPVWKEQNLACRVFFRNHIWFKRNQFLKRPFHRNIRFALTLNTLKVINFSLCRFINASSFFLFTEKAHLEVKVEVQQPIKQTSFYLNPKFVLNSNQPWSLVGKINCIHSTIFFFKFNLKGSFASKS